MEDLVPNTHYRVGVTAESSMGVSQNNHVLHFSTRVLAKQGPIHGASDNPTSSTLPPRSGIRIPRALEEAVRASSPLSSRPYSPAYSQAHSPGAESRNDDTRSMLSALSGARDGPRKAIPQRPASTVPPGGAAAGAAAADAAPRAQSTTPYSSAQPAAPYAGAPLAAPVGAGAGAAGAAPLRAAAGFGGAVAPSAGGDAEAKAPPPATATARTSRRPPWAAQSPASRSPRRWRRRWKRP